MLIEGFPGGSVVRDLPIKQETLIQSLGQENLPENGSHSSILAREIPWTEKSDGLQFMGSQRVRHELVTR